MENLSPIVLKYRKKRRYIKWFEQTYKIVSLPCYNVESYTGFPRDQSNPNLDLDKLKTLGIKSYDYSLWANPNINYSTMINIGFKPDIRSYCSNINITEELIKSNKLQVKLSDLCKNESISIDFLIEEFGYRIYEDIHCIANISKRNDVGREHFLNALAVIKENNIIRIGNILRTDPYIKCVRVALTEFAKKGLIYWEDIKNEDPATWPYDCITFIESITLDIIKSAPYIKWNFEDILKKPGITWNYVKVETRIGRILDAELQLCTLAWSNSKELLYMRPLSRYKSKQNTLLLEDNKEMPQLSEKSCAALRTVLTSGIYPIKNARKLPPYIRNIYIAYHPEYTSDVYFHETEPRALLVNPNISFDRVEWYLRDVFAESNVRESIYESFKERIQKNDINIDTVLKYPLIIWDIDALLKNANIYAECLLVPNIINCIRFDPAKPIYGLYSDEVFEKHYNRSVREKRNKIYGKLILLLPKDILRVIIKYVGYE